MDTKNYFNKLSPLIKLNPKTIIFAEDFVDCDTMEIYQIIRSADFSEIVWPEGMDWKIPSNITADQVTDYIYNQYTPAMQSQYKAWFEYMLSTH